MATVLHGVYCTESRLFLLVRPREDRTSKGVGWLCSGDTCEARHHWHQRFSARHHLAKVLHKDSSPFSDLFLGSPSNLNDAGYILRVSYGPHVCLVWNEQCGLPGVNQADIPEFLRNPRPDYGAPPFKT